MKSSIRPSSSHKATSSNESKSIKELYLLSSLEKEKFTRWLTFYRKRWQNYHNYLDDEVLKEIVEKVPVNEKELKKIKGLNLDNLDDQIRRLDDVNYYNPLLATIYSFLEKNKLLQHYPNCVLPKMPFIDEIWYNPESKKIILYINHFFSNIISFTIYILSYKR